MGSESLAGVSASVKALPAIPCFEYDSFEKHKTALHAGMPVCRAYVRYACMHACMQARMHVRLCRLSVCLSVALSVRLSDSEGMNIYKHKL